jgi:WD40 repeat protein/serine/threonine protein kinase
MSAKRNLLLGILALQNNFINRAQLLAGFNAWVEDKGQSLGALLVAQKALSPREQEMLEFLADRHLGQHGQDADRSLAALSPVPSARQELQRIFDPDVQDSLASLTPAASPPPAGDELDPDGTAWSAGGAGGPGRFRILRPHAAGGLGQVSVALDRELNRQVALKEIKPEHADNAEARTRFLLEAEVTGGLEHPGIVPVYSLGAYADGRPFYAMRFIKGDSLKDAIQQFHPPKPRGESASLAGRSPDFQSLAFRKLLGRFVDVCNAIAYAHSRGVLHRDLKPGNIMLGKYGETLVVDWGLAKAGVRGSESAVREAAPAAESLLRPGSGSGSAETLPGEAMGTLAYMSPEQAAGKLDQLGPASDVYSLGATLYCVLTGRAPFEHSDVAAVLANVKRGDFPRPRQVQPEVPAALEAVCLRAMALRPADRYRTARELAEEVERWLADAPVLAWPEPWSARARRWASRHRVLITSAAACLAVATVALTAGIVIVSQANADLEEANQTTSRREEETQQANERLAKANQGLVRANEEIKKREAQTQQAHRELEKANQGLVKANAAEKTAREEAEGRLALSTMMLARSRFEEGQAALAHELLEQVPDRFRFAGWRLLRNYATGSVFTLRGHTDSVRGVAFSGDGQLLASASEDRTVKVWAARTGQELRTLRGHNGPVSSVAFSADGQLLASASVDRTVKVWAARTGQELRTLRGHTQEVYGVTFSGDGQLLASGSADGTVKVWEAQMWQELRTLRGHTDLVWSVAFSGDGQLVASASHDRMVKVWEARTGQELRTLRGHTGSVSGVAFSADDQLLASASWDGTVKVWEARTGQELRTLRGHTSYVYSVAFSGDGQLLASGSADGTVKVWEARTGQELRTLRTTDLFYGVAFGPVHGVAFSADDQLLASASWGRTVKVWKARTGQELRTLRGHTDLVSGVAFSGDGQLLASASWDGTVKVWEARTGQELRTLRGHTGYVYSVAFSADGQLVASAGRDGTVKVWEARTGQELRTLQGYSHTGPVYSVAFSGNGQLLASGSADGTVKMWAARTRQELGTLRGFTGSVSGVAFSGDGQLLASANAVGTVKVWEAQTGQELRTLRGHTGSVSGVAFSADGQLLASAGADGTVRLWDLRTGQELRTLRGHTNVVEGVAFSGDGQLLASASWDGTVKVWDTRSSQEPGVEARFRLWVTAPDLDLHRERAQQADNEKQPLALAFRLGRYLAAKQHYAGGPKEAAGLAGWVATAAQPPGLLPGLPAAVKTPLHAPTFPDGIACTGVLCKDSGIAPKRLLIGTARALEGDPSSWLNRAFHGGALYRNGAHAEALAELTEAARLYGKPSPLTHHLLALTCLALGQTEKARIYLEQARPDLDAPWEDVYLDRLLRPEVEAALAWAQGPQSPKEK